MQSVVRSSVQRFWVTTQDVSTHAWDVNASPCTLETLKHGNHVLVLWHL